MGFVKNTMVGKGHAQVNIMLILWRFFSNGIKNIFWFKMNYLIHPALLLLSISIKLNFKQFMKMICQRHPKVKETLPFRLHQGMCRNASINHSKNTISHQVVLFANYTIKCENFMIITIWTWHFCRNSFIFLEIRYTIDNWDMKTSIGITTSIGCIFIIYLFRSPRRVSRYGINVAQLIPKRSIQAISTN